MRCRNIHNVPHYPQRHIGSVPILARTLGIKFDQLSRLASDADYLYREVPQVKKDGTPRLTYDAKGLLKAVHGRIVKQIFRSVRFPDYLHGGIKDIHNPRDQFSNAAMHTGAAIVINEDIQDFYPSLTFDVVYSIWTKLFHFAPDVAHVLTCLTTYRGILPQGARTSSYLANLAFWDTEPEVVKSLELDGFTYSRFADDVTISSKHMISSDEKTKLIAKVYGLLAKKGCRPKRCKHKIQSRGKRLEVTGLVVNRTRPTIAKDERRRIRAAVEQVERQATSNGSIKVLGKMYRSATGRVLRLKRAGHPEGAKLKNRLDLIACLLPPEERLGKANNNHKISKKSAKK